MSAGYYFATGTCLLCGEIFNFNPHLVPSIPIGENGKPAIDGTRQPVCRACAESMNLARRGNGLPLFVITDAAYEPTEGLP